MKSPQAQPMETVKNNWGTLSVTARFMAVYCLRQASDTRAFLHAGPDFPSQLVGEMGK